MSTTDSISDSELQTFADLPPSAKLVIKALEGPEYMSRDDIIKETYLPPRTVSHALKRLIEDDVIAIQLDTTDGRRRVYAVSDKYREISKDIYDYYFGSDRYSHPDKL